MKAYNIPTDELHINSNAGEELVSITPEKAMVKNLDVSSMGITSSAEEIDTAVAKAETIPAIESGDAGKALVVNESEDGFELASVGGGGDDSILLVNVTYDDDWVIDVPYTDIKSAIAAGKPVILAQYSGGTPLMVFQYSCTLGSGNTEKMKFVSFYIPNDTPSTMKLHIATLNPNYQTQGEWSIFSTSSKSISLS